MIMSLYDSFLIVSLFIVRGLDFSVIVKILQKKEHEFIYLFFCFVLWGKGWGLNYCIA